MRKNLKRTIWRRSICVLLASSMVLCSPAADSGMLTGIFQKISLRAEAAAINDDTILDSNIVPDSTLLKYLRDTVVAEAAKENVTLQANSLTIKNLSDWTDSKKLTIPAGVTNVKGLNWAQYVAEVDASSCSGLSTIVEGGFDGCEKMTKCTLPAKVTRVEDYAFRNCKNLSDINIGNLTYIGVESFAACANLSDAVIAELKDSVQNLGSGAFQGCSSITTAKVPVISQGTDVHTVPKNLFQNCAKLKKVTFADSALTGIGDSAFTGTGELTFRQGSTGEYGDKLPSTVNNIGVSAFSVSKVRSLDLSATKVTKIANSTFYQAELQDKILLPANLVSIGDEAFRKSGLAEIDMPNSVTEIGKRSFRATPNLRKVILSKEIQVIPEEAFQGAGVGTEEGANAVEPKEDEEDNYQLIVSFHGSEPSASKITEIAGSAFNASLLTNDFIKDLTHLTKIGDEAFSYTNFTTLTIPSCVEKIGKESFNGMYYLTEVTFAKGSKVTEIPEMAFGGDSLPNRLPDGWMTYGDLILEKVQLPEKLQKIDTQAFAYCTSLETVGYPGQMKEGVLQFPKTLTEIGEKSFLQCGSYSATEENEFINLYIWGILHGDEVTEGKSSSVGIQEVVLPDSLTTAGKNAFADNVVMKKITIGDGLKEIPEAMCSGCSVEKVKGDTVENHYPASGDDEGGAKDGKPVPYVGLQQIKFSDKVEKIGRDAFRTCRALEGFVGDTGNISSAGDLPKNLQEIGEYAFAECKSLTAVRFPSALKMIGAGAFREASQDINENYEGEYYTYHQYYGLSKIDFTYATTLTAIGAGAFARTAIESIAFPDTVAEIPESVCEDCYLLGTVTMGKDVKEVKANAFGNCYSLTSATLPLSAEWDKTLFSGSTANKSGKLTVMAASSEENVSVIYGRENTLESRCFHSFDRVPMTLTDAEKEETDPQNDLLRYDINQYIKASRGENDNIITLYGKEEGDTKIKLTGLLDLREMKLNNSNIAISISQIYNVKVTRVPITKITLSSDNMSKEAGEDVLYLDGTGSGGVDVTAAYEPEDTTDHITWSVDNESVATLSTAQPDQEDSASTVQVTAGDYGETQLKASATTIDAKCKVRVRVPAESAELSSTIMGLDINKSGKLDLTLTYSDGLTEKAKDFPDVYEFTSSDESVITIDPRTGEYTTHAEGTATITVRSLVTGHTLTCSVTVEEGYVPPAESIEINKSDSAKYEDDQLVMYVGDTVKLTATVLPIFADQTITWESSDEAVVTVSDGEVKAFKAGSASVKARTSNGIEARCDVVVKAKVESITLSETTLKMTIGDKKALDATVLPAEAEQSVDWTSSDEAVATVTEAGGVEALKSGKTTITATAEDGQKATCEVTVSAKTESIKFAEEKAKMNVGETKKLAVTILPAEANQSLLWTSSDEKVAKVDSNGTVTALQKGSVSITAASIDNVTATCSIEISSPAKNLKIRATNGSTSKIYVKKGSSLTLSPFYSNSDCTDTFQFSAKKSKVGSVTKDGQVKTKKTGKLVVTLTAYSDDEKKVKNSQAKFTVQVLKKNKKAKKISVSGKKAVNVSEKIGLTAKLKPGKATSKVTWSSKNTSVATVDEYGVVTGVAAGKVKITAKISKKKKKTITVQVNAAPEETAAK